MKKLSLITFILCLAISACAQNKSKFFEWRQLEYDGELSIFDDGDEFPYYLDPIGEQSPHLKGAQQGMPCFKDKYYLESVIYPILNECLSKEFISFLCTPPHKKPIFILYFDMEGTILYGYFSIYDDEMKNIVKKNEADLYKFYSRLKQQKIDMNQVDYFLYLDKNGRFDFARFNFRLAFRKWVSKYPAKK